MKSRWNLTLLGNLVGTIALVALWSLASVVVVVADDCKPTADEVALFRNENYSGPCVMKGFGEHRVIQSSKSGPLPASDVQRRSLPSFSSIKVGANAEALACSEPNLNGTCVLIYQDTPNFSGREISTVSSLIVRRKDQPPQCRPGANQVAHWYREYFFGDCWIHEVGAVDGTKTRIGSLRVGANVEAQLCDDFFFEGTCVVVLPGYYSRLSFLRFREPFASMAIRRKDQPPSCAPGANQVAVYQYGHYVGPCSVLDTGVHSLNETLTWVAQLPDWENVVRSIRVGENVQATFCWISGTGGRRRPRICAHPLSIDVPRGFRELKGYEQVSLTVQQRGATPPAGDRGSRREAGNAPPAVSAHDFTVSLAPSVPYTGLPWWTGRYPTIGRLDGNLTRVANPRNSYWLGFLKPGYNNPQDDCGDSNNYVRLNPGETMTADQLNTIFGSQTPSLPVQFVVCSNAQGQRNAEGGLNFPGLPLNITYTRR